MFETFERSVEEQIADIKAMDKAMDEAWKEATLEDKELREKDETFLVELKQQVTLEYFEKIKCQLKESENSSDYCFVNEPVGDRQNKGDCLIWIDSDCGYFEDPNFGYIFWDNSYGTICMRIDDGIYFKWNFLKD